MTKINHVSLGAVYIYIYIHTYSFIKRKEVLI